MKLFITILFCAAGFAQAAERSKDDPAAYVPGRDYPVSTNEGRPYLSWTGSKSGVKERGCFRVTTREEWTDLWLRHTSQRAPALYRNGKFNHLAVPDGVPQVDFSRCVVVAVFQGPASDSDGFDIAGVVHQGEATILRLVERWNEVAAGPGDSSRRAALSVFGLYVLPRSEKALIVEESVQHHIGGPLIWKARARFDPGDKPRS